MKINVDAGHGSNTAGKRTPPIPGDIDINGDGKIDIKKGEQYREHYANVGVANFLIPELERCGFQTHKTGWDDKDASDDPDTLLSSRQSSIAKAGCDYSISIHFNAYGDGKSFNTAEGVGIYIHNRHIGQSQKLTEIVLKHLAGGTDQKNRGITKKSLAMCNCNSMDVKGAILVELAFMTNFHEATELMVNEVFWKECAQEICRGMCEYTGVNYIPEIYIPENTITPESSKEDIMWTQMKLNDVLPNIPDITPLNIDGDYGPITRIAVLYYWFMLGWGKHLRDDGTRIGKSTRKALAEGRIE